MVGACSTFNLYRLQANAFEEIGNSIFGRGLAQAPMPSRRRGSNCEGPDPIQECDTTKAVTPAASAWAIWAGFSLEVMTTG